MLKMRLHEVSARPIGLVRRFAVPAKLTTTCVRVNLA